MNLYFKYMKVHFMSTMSYRKSFILLSIGQFFLPLTIMISIVLMFQRFGELKGWTLYEVALCYAVIHMAFSTAECFGRGFDSFSQMIRQGNFDRIMLRPRNTILQVFGSKFEFTRVGRLLQGLAVFVFATLNIQVDLTPFKLFVLVMMVLGGIVIFFGIYILGASLCFLTVEGLEVVNIFTDGGREMAQYPLNIYKKAVQKFFTFIIPFAIVNYYPLLYVLDKSDKIIYAFTPFLSILFIGPCILVWQLGVKHYKSTGS